MSKEIYFVATPIGNLKDITYRAIQVLQNSEVIICEDTRVTKKLLDAYEIKKPLLSIHQHSEVLKIENLLSKYKDAPGYLSFVSDAGTPNVNDPGGMMAEYAFKHDFKVIPIPGSSSLTSAISVCGFPMENFTYLGFVPHKKGRQTFFKNISEIEHSVIFLESTHRLEKTLESLVQELSNERIICVCRELTKIYETIYRGSAEQVLNQVKQTSTKGESTIIIAPKNFK